MMNATPSSPRLPDEIICEIFRDSCFSQLDFTWLCLVSHRFLSTARKCLYAMVPVILVGGGPASESDDEGGSMTRSEDEPWQWTAVTDGGDWMYTIPTLKLLRTVDENPEIAQAIEGIGLHSKIYDTDYNSSDRPSGETADSDEALSAFLASSPRVKKIVINNRLEDAHLYPIIVEERPNLEHLSVYTISLESLNLLAQQLPNLKSLKIEDIEFPRSSLSGSDSAFQTLEHLQLEDELLEIEHLSFLPSFSSTLRSLRISLTIILSLDFSQYPSLDSLHFYNSHSHSLRNEPSCKILERFAHSVSKSPSLRNISFQGYSFPQNYEVSQTWEPPVLQTLEIIKIEGRIDLERLVAVLSWPFVRNVRRIIVSAEKNAYRYGTDKINAVRGICEGRGIELVYQNDDKLDDWHW